MTTPRFYDPHKIDQLYAPDTQTAVEEGLRANLKPAARDSRRVILLLVDPQVDFIHTKGALSVPGAVDDTQRTIEWIYRNAEEVTAIAASLDSHTPMQIFYATWWTDEQGNHPAPFTSISAEDVAKGRWKPVIEPRWSIDYVHKLEKQARKTLMIWPYHTMIGTPGQAIVPALYEAIAYHSAARRAQPTFLTKGSIAKTENYSILEPEVKVPDHPMGGLNTAFLDMLATYDLIYVAGQAKSHCVLETVTSIMSYFKDQPDVIDRLRFMMDCTSSVQHPAVDFEALANQALAEFEKQGMHMVTSKDRIG
ncbi:MAG: cysteine hydrolase family protein [Anaerolineae bacterium]|nr:cysteine hydrolase family protein [Anaerolineae bacterium]